MKGPNPVWMSASEKTNQSRPRWLACEPASCAAGAGRSNTVADARSRAELRSSRPPVSSSESVDSPLSPASWEFTASGSRRMRYAPASPLFPCGATVIGTKRDGSTLGPVALARRQDEKSGEFENSTHGTLVPCKMELCSSPQSTLPVKQISQSLHFPSDLNSKNAKNGACSDSIGTEHASLFS